VTSGRWIDDAAGGLPSRCHRLRRPGVAVGDASDRRRAWPPSPSANVGGTSS